MRTYTALASLAALTITTLATAQVIPQPAGNAEAGPNRPQDAVRNLFLGRPKQMPMGHQTHKTECEDARNPSNPERWYTAQDGWACMITEVTPLEDTIQGKSLVDVLTVERKGSLWWEYARDVVRVVSQVSGSHSYSGLLQYYERLLYGDGDWTCVSLFT
jgi:hypothetical protein